MLGLQRRVVCCAVSGTWEPWWLGWRWAPRASTALPSPPQSTSRDPASSTKSSLLSWTPSSRSLKSYRYVFERSSLQFYFPCWPVQQLSTPLLHKKTLCSRTTSFLIVWKKRSYIANIYFFIPDNISKINNSKTCHRHVYGICLCIHWLIFLSQKF